MIGQQFEERCEREAVLLEDRLLRYVSSPQEHDLALAIAWPFVFRAIVGRFPWEPNTGAAPHPEHPQ